MLVCEDGFVDIDTPTGPMRTYVYRPKPSVEGIPEKHPGIVLYSEIFQQTKPVARTAIILAGHGFVVYVPEVYHELLPIGTVLSYTPEDSAKGNACKTDKELSSYDGDFKAAVDHLTASPHCTGAVGVAGMCLGGGLAFRAAIVCPSVKCCVAWYPTDLHKAGLSKTGDDSLKRCAEAKGCRFLMLFGTADPHIPREGRRQIEDAMAAAELKYEWHEFTGAHAFLRDENSFGRAFFVCASCSPFPFFFAHARLAHKLTQ